MSLNDVDPADYKKIEQRWLELWHLDPKFCRLTPVEQWLIVLKEYLERKAKRDENPRST